MTRLGDAVLHSPCATNPVYDRGIPIIRSRVLEKERKTDHAVSSTRHVRINLEFQNQHT